MSPVKHKHPEGPYWRSLGELAGDPDLQRLVDHGVEPPDLLTPSRRGFLKALGASAALAGLAACRWPEEQILPYAHRPADRTPGVPQHFATAMEIDGVALPLVVTSYDGRPIKIEGNPAHPASAGASSTIAQASVLGLYDPDRSRNPMKGEQVSDWDAAEAWLAARLEEHQADAGAGLHLLMPLTSSPTAQLLVAEIRARLPKVRVHRWSPIARLNESLGALAALGQPGRPLLDPEQAHVLLAVDEDLFQHHPDAVRLAGQWGRSRDPDREHMLQLISVESGLSLTGAVADHRLPLAPSHIPGFLGAVALALFDTHHVSVPAGAEAFVAALRKELGEVQAPELAAQTAQALAEAGVHGAVCVGPAQDAVVHAVGWLINTALRSRAVAALPAPGRMVPDLLDDLVGAMDLDEVKTLLVLDTNPVFDAPSPTAHTEPSFAAALAKVPHSAHLGLYRDETGQACQWHLPMAHYLEAWGDARSWDGTFTTIQPLIEPLYAGRSVIELLSFLATGAHTPGYALARKGFGIDEHDDAVTLRSTEQRWAQALQDGFAPTRYDARAPSLEGSLAADLTKGGFAPAPQGGLELRFAPCAKLLDGRFANNAWLQELPDPISKLTWDNAALISPATAESMGVTTGDMLSVSVDGATIEIAACLVPGIAADTAVLPLGYGRRAGGAVAALAGFDVYPLRASTRLWAASGASATKLGRRHTLASTQDHHGIDARGAAEAERRVSRLVRTADLADYKHHPDFAQHVVHAYPAISSWKEHEYKEEAWGMIIDLNKCTGCGACTMACQAENNIPVVGKDDVVMGREMHWIRNDRYFAGDPAQPEVAFQPLTCMHCELAPCEQVCPVAATQHSDDGINTMVYNRCVGTRYCANNCPYKVRRFNFFAYTKGAGPIEQMVRNPEVTVRSRGVMEKCSFCQQRISAARIKARNEGRDILDGETLPACAQVCPAGAISFGDYNDPDSRVAALAQSPRTYELLPELNLKQRTRYMARIKNPLTTDHEHEHGPGPGADHGSPTEPPHPQPLSPEGRGEHDDGEHGGQAPTMGPSTANEELGARSATARQQPEKQQNDDHGGHQQ